MSSALAVLLLLVLSVPHAACGDEDPAPASPAAPEGDTPAQAKPTIIIETSAGIIEAELWPAAAPKTVKTFVGLANGTLEYKDLKTGAKKTGPFYDGLSFHRIIKGFMLQGGCPNGNGSGGPGFFFEDEINATGLGLDKEKLFVDDQGRRPHNAILGILGRTPQQQQATFQRTIILPLLKKLGIPLKDANARASEWQPKLLKLTLKEVYENQGYKYNDTLETQAMKKYTLALANSGPNTNGSQFFINLVDNPYLNGKHTVFGKVTKGFDIVDKLGDVAVGAGAKPVEPVKIIKIRSK